MTRDSTNSSSNAGNGPQSQSNALKSAFRYFGFKNPKTASWPAIRKKYRKLSLLHHPDRNNGSEESKIKMQKINRCYELLKEEFEKREEEGPKGPNRPPNNPTTDAPKREKESTGANTTTGQGNPSTNKTPKPNREASTSEYGISHEERQRRRKAKEQQRQKAKKQRRKVTKCWEEARQKMTEEQRKKEMEGKRKKAHERENKEREEKQRQKQQQKEREKEMRKMDPVVEFVAYSVVFVLQCACWYMFVEL